MGTLVPPSNPDAQKRLLQRAQLGRISVLWLAAGLGLLLAAITFLTVADGNLLAGLLYILVKCLPLILPIPMILRDDPKGYIYLCILLLVYFSFACLSWLDATGLIQVLRTAQIGWILVLFTLAGLTARWRKLAIAILQTR